MKGYFFLRFFRCVCDDICGVNDCGLGVSDCGDECGCDIPVPIYIFIFFYFLYFYK